MKNKIFVRSVILAAIVGAIGTANARENTRPQIAATPSAPTSVARLYAAPDVTYARYGTPLLDFDLMSALAPRVAPVFTLRDTLLAARVAALPSALEAALLSPPLRAGDKAPNFTLPDQKGRFHRLADLRGKLVVLSFYPQDFTMMCTTEAVGFTRYQPKFEARDAVVFGISVQPVSSKYNFAGYYGVKQPLLADMDRKVARAYRVLNRDGLAGRVTFIIGPQGTILATDQNVHAATHAQDVLATIDKLTSRRFESQFTTFVAR